MKKIYLIIFTFILSLNVVNGLTNTIPRTDDDLGVNKHWNITEKNINNIKRTPKVNATEKIYDFGEILTEKEINKLNEKIIKLVEKTKMDIVILTTDFEYSDEELESFAVDFYDYNDFGIDFNNYSGILFLRNKNDYNRFFNIYTFGDAQKYFTYNECEKILDNVYYDIKNDYYLNGFNEFINEINYYYDLGSKENITIDENGKIKETFNIPFMPAIIISGIITIIIMIVLIKKNKMIKKETQAVFYKDKNSVVFRNKVDKFLHSHTSSYIVNSNSTGSHNGFSGGSHVGSSGGFHGGGGGRHG